MEHNRGKSTAIPSIRPVDAGEWSKLVHRFRDLSFRQGAIYGECAAADIAARSETMAIESQGRLVGLANVRVKRMPVLPIGLAYALGGPLTVQDPGRPLDALGTCLDGLVDEYVRRRSLLLRVSPPTLGGLWSAEQTKVFEERGFYNSPNRQSKSTIIIDLAPSLSEIRQGLDKKWRWELTQAEKSDVIIVRSTSPADLVRFEPIFLDLSRIKQFSARQDVRFYHRVLGKSSGEEGLVLHMAIRDDRLIAGHLGSFAGDTAVYLLGAANEEGRKTRASYLLQWAVITHARSLGQRYYDLGGIDQQNNPDVYRFKNRMNGRHVHELGPYDLSPGPMSALVLRGSEALYGHMRNLRMAVKKQ